MKGFKCITLEILLKMFLCMLRLKFNFLVFWRPFSLFSSVQLVSKFHVNSVVEGEYLDM